jgi:hypothetical protein
MEDDKLKQNAPSIVSDWSFVPQEKNENYKKFNNFNGDKDQSVTY